MKKKYKNLIQNATDIIFETDAEGNFIFVNDFTIAHLGYAKEEIIGKHFTYFVSPDYQEVLQQFYKDFKEAENNFPTIEFPVIRKDLTQLWCSQKVFVNKNELGKFVSYSGIMRDITVFKDVETKERNRLNKIENFNKAVNALSTSNISHFDNFSDLLVVILKTAAEATNTDLVSYVSFAKDKIKSQINYDLHAHTTELIKLNPEDFSAFDFSEIKEKKIINIPNVKANSNKEFCYSFNISEKYNSRLLVSVFHTNLLSGILCFSTIKENTLWDSEDLNFTRTISNIISLSLELQSRLESERMLKYKSEVLSVVSQCTELFLSSSKPLEELPQIFSLLGNVTDVDHIYYYENDINTALINQKLKWAKDGVQLQITPLQTFTHDNFAPILKQASSKKPFIAKIEDLENSFLKSLLTTNQIRSIIILPMYFNSEFSGFLGFDSCSEDRIWTADEITIFQLFTNNISSVLQRFKNEKLKDESEVRFKLLANNIPGTVYLSKCDAHWTKIFLTNQIEELTGYSKAAFIDGRINFSDLIHEDDRTEILQLSAKKIFSGEKLHLTYRIRTKDNNIKWVEEFADIIIENNVIKYIEGIFIDITQRKKNESAIIDKELAQSESKAKSEFLANMSHEIKTPLNGIIGFTDLLMKTTLSSEQQNYMNTVHQSANALLGIINDILDFSKIEAGKLALDFQPVVINELVESIRQIVRFDLERKKLQLYVIIDESLPKILYLDPLRINQILLNLVSNAIKFTSQGAVTIGFKLNKGSDLHTYSIGFYVKDTGIGIASENQKKIFSPFEQEDNSTTRKYGGTGLGLTITNKLLELMGSKLSLKSEFLKGSTFYFDLNVLKSEFYIPEHKKINIFNSTIETTKLKMKILIAEDNAINMLLIKTILKGIFPNAQLFESSNGEEVIAQFKIVQPDLILMDIQMPLLNGIEATHQIRAFRSPAEVPIIALTAGNLKEEREVCLSAGMNDFISKPIVRETIKEVILKWISITNDLQLASD